MTEGINDMLFHLLWAKDNVFDTIPNIKIPQTVIFKYYQPRYWYFTSKSGIIKRKCKEKLTKSQIQQEFLKDVSASGIVAVFNYVSQNKRIAEFFNAEALNNFLFLRNIENDGILQKFIDPLGPKNFSLTAVWTPNFCMFEKKENKLDLYNQNFDIYERATTFEGKEYFVETSGIRGTDIPAKMQGSCDSIVSHVAAVTFEKIKIVRMVIQFRIDPKMKL